MSNSPTTPAKASMHATELSSKVVPKYAEKINTTSEVKHASFNEPSPASTYGETEAGSSTPATPLESAVEDTFTGITRSMRVVQLDPAVASITGSPLISHEAKNYSRSEQYANQVVQEDGGSSPLRPNGFEEVRYIASTTSSPASDRIGERSGNAEWRYGTQGRFVHHSGSHTDDPFVSTGVVEPSASQDVIFPQHPNRVGEKPTKETAQAIYPPQACVFVANLTQSDTDDQLEHAVTQAFAQFGKVYIKIRRDARQMPFAFAQYENPEDARRAITLGRGMLINGRPCRTEVAKVNRSLYLSKIAGGQISENEARQVLTGSGPIQRVWLCSQTDREMYRLPEGIFVMFAFFDDCRDAQMKFRDHSTHRLEQPKMVEDIRGHLGSRVRQSPGSPPFKRPSPGRLSSPTSMRRVADMRSVFVGNLPSRVTEENLYSIFQMYGHITHIEIVRKPSVVNAGGVNAFAFIEFATPDGAIIAVQASPKLFQGLRLRVERKETSAPSPGRSSFSGGSPGGRTLESQEAMMIYQRGFSVGLSQAAQAQVTPPPVYGQYPYYQPFDSSLAQYAPSPSAIPTDAAYNFQPYGNGYVPSQVGQIQHPLASASYAPFQNVQHHPLPQIVANPSQQAQHGFRPYQWPLADASIENASGLPVPTNSEAH